MVTNITKKFVYILMMTLLILPVSLKVSLAEDNLNVSAQANVTNIGWMPTVGNNSVIGTVGQSQPLQAFDISLNEMKGIRYRAYIQDIGWENWVENGAVIGTINENKAIEAVEIVLTDDVAQAYTVYYRAHVRDIGWLDWASSGKTAGTTRLSLPLEAIEIKIVPNTEPVSLKSDYPAFDMMDVENSTVLSYSSHISQIGWQNPVPEGSTSGTVGESLPIEAIQISATNLGMNSDISYRSYVENIGWTDPVGNGQISGTQGQNLSIESISINLVGLANALNDIYYRVHVHNIGWLDWAKNGESAGSEGLALPIEALEIQIVTNGAPAPGATNFPHVDRNQLMEHSGITSRAYVENIGWMDPVGAGQMIGTEGQDLGIEGLTMSLDSLPNSSINYNVLVEDYGWLGSSSNNACAGIIGQNKQMETIAIELTGPASNLFDVYYQAHCEDYGWLGWAKNGEWSGTSGGNRKLEAIRVQLVLKNEAAPGSMDNEYIQAEPKRTIYTKDNVDQFNLICAIVQHEGGDEYNSALAVMSCVMNRVDSGRWGGNDPVSVLTAPGQFESYLAGYYRQFLANPSPVVQQAVLDCLNGARSHPYQSFRAYPTAGSVHIGGNWYF